MIIGITTYFTTYSDLILEFSEDPDYIESSIKNNKVIVNDLENDYNYYQGQNYLDNDGTLPTTDNKNIYNDIWECLARPAKRLSVDTIINFSEKLTGKVVEKLDDGIIRIKFSYNNRRFS